MRLAIVLNDFYAPIARALLEDGREVARLISAGPTRLPVAETNEQVARSFGLPFGTEALTREALASLRADGVDTLLSAGYPRRIPVDGSGMRLLNIHPSPLPEGRGPAPLEWAILQGRTSTAVTLHEMVERFDAGPILVQRALPIAPDETIDQLRYRVRSASVGLAVEAFRSLESLWSARAAQGPGTYCRVPRRKDRTIDPGQPTEQVDRMLRAFSPGSRFIRLGRRELVVGFAECWKEQHAQAPGAVLGRKGRRLLVSTADGLLLFEQPASARGALLAGLRYRARQLSGRSGGA